VRRLRSLRLLDELLRRWSDWHRQAGSQPLLRGQELIDELGLEPGPIFGRILSAVEEGQLDGQIATRDQALGLAKRLAEKSKAGDS